MSEKPKTCSNCWSSMFRRKHGETQLYCGYWYKPVELYGVCDEHNTNGHNYNYNPVEHKRNHNRRVACFAKRQKQSERIRDRIY